MKVTSRCLLFNMNEECEKTLDKMMLQFCSAMRFSYNEMVRKLDDSKFKPHHLDSLVSSKYNLNTRQAKDAIEIARQTKQSQVELLDERIKNLESKVEGVLKALDNKNLSGFKRNGLISKLDKRLRKLSKFIYHKNNKTLPTVIFGGKENFYKRCRNEISNEEYNKNRNNHFVARGDATKKGNPNLRIVIDKGMTFLEITTLEKVLKKDGTPHSRNYKKIRTPLYIPVKKSKKTGKVNGFNYKAKLLEIVALESPYQVELIKKNNKIYAHITFTLDEPPKVATAHKYMIGVDTNPDGLALTMIDRQGNYVWHTYLKDSRLIHAKSSIRDNICGELACVVIRIAKTYGAGIAVEDLEFKDNVDVKKKFARIKNQFCYSKLISSLLSASYKYGVEILKVKPHFTSKIGLYKYCSQYGMYVHNGAAMVIARRAYGFIEKVPSIYKNMFKDVIKLNSENSLSIEKTKVYDEFSKWNHISKRFYELLRRDNVPRFFIENRKNIVELIAM